MGCNVAEVSQLSRGSPVVHASMCNELRTLKDKISSLIPEIESAQPGCKLGIEELCSLNNSLEKAKRLIEHFAESSKLYLVITGDTSVSRCEHLRNAIDKSLSHIQTMVPEPLSTQILNAIDSLRDTKFVIDSSEKEARNALLSLLRQNYPTESSELEAFQIAASKLHLTSSKALLVERRSVKKLLNGSGSKKEGILKYLIHLLTTYGKKVQTGAVEYNENVSVVGTETQRKRHSSGEVSFQISTPIEEVQKEIHPENDIESNLSSGALIPEEFLCPITSTLMYDPVVIASGQTFERQHIEKWFKEGHNICPKTQIKLPNLKCTPNAYLKGCIYQWCETQGIILQGPYLQMNSEPFCSWSSDTLSSSFNSFNGTSGVTLGSRNEDYIFQSNSSNTSIISSEASWISASSHTKGILNLADVNHANMFMWSDDYQKYKSFSCFSYDSYLKFLSELSQLPVEVHCKALEDLKLLLSKGDSICCLMLSNGFLESLVMFLKDAYDSSQVIAQKAGVQILLDFLKYNRVDLSSRSDQVCSLLTCFLDSKNVNLEALKIIRAFCSYQGCKSAIVASDVTWQIIDTLDSDEQKLQEAALDILDKLSSVKEAVLLISSPVCLLKLSSLITEKEFARVCLKILQNLCQTKEGGTAIANAEGCLSSIVENLEYGSREEQAVAVSVLLSLCSWSPENSDLVMKEGVIPSLVDLSVNGNDQSRRDSTELLQILRDLGRRSDCPESSDGMRDLPSPSPSTTKLDPIHYYSDNENLQGYHNHTENFSFPCDGSGSQTPMGHNKSSKKGSTSKLSALFGRKFSKFSKR